MDLVVLEVWKVVICDFRCFRLTTIRIYVILGFRNKCNSLWIVCMVCDVLSGVYRSLVILEFNNIIM